MSVELKCPCRDSTELHWSSILGAGRQPGDGLGAGCLNPSTTDILDRMSIRQIDIWMVGLQ